MLNVCCGCMRSWLALGQERVWLEYGLVLEWCSCRAEWCTQLTTSEKWCLTLSVAMDTYFSEGFVAASHVTPQHCYERHLGLCYFVYLSINIYLICQFGAKMCEWKAHTHTHRHTNAPLFSLPAPAALNILAVAAECQQVVEGVAGGWEVPAAGQQGGWWGFGRYSCPCRHHGDEWQWKRRAGSGVRHLACCSQSLREYIILLPSELAGKHIRRWLRGWVLKFCQRSRNGYCFKDPSETERSFWKKDAFTCLVRRILWMSCDLLCSFSEPAMNEFVAKLMSN